MADRLSGKSAYLTFNGYTLPFKKLSQKVTRKCADSTDSGDYYTQNDMLFPTQIPVSVKTEQTIEGTFRFSSTPQAVVTALYTSLTNIPAQFGLNASGQLGTGNVDITDFSCDAPVDDIVTWTATMTSNGQWTPL